MVELEESEVEHSEADESSTEHSLGESSGIVIWYRTNSEKKEGFSLEVLWV